MQETEETKKEETKKEERVNIVLSPSSINSLCACPRQYFYSRIMRIEPDADASDATDSKGGAKEKGILMHIALKIYYQARKKGASVQQAKDVALLYSRIKAGALTLPLPVCEFVLGQFDEYVDHYAVENWKVLAVEEQFSMVLHEDERIRIIIEGIIDLVVKADDIIFAVDHKTGVNKSAPSPMSNQFKAYCMAGKFKYLIVNRLALQKTKAPKEKFFRYHLTYKQDQLEEWKQDVIYWADRALYYFENQHWPRNETSCDNFGKCSYIKICSSNGKVRKFFTDRDYRKMTEPRWNPITYDKKKKEEDEWITKELAKGR